MKNWSIRRKMLSIYGVMILFTLTLFLVAVYCMYEINAGTGSEVMIRRFILVFLPYSLLYVGVTYAVGRSISKQVAYPTRQLIASARKIAKGDIDVDLPPRTEDEIGVLTNSFHDMVEALQEQAEVLRVIAKGDFTAKVEKRCENDVINSAIIDILRANNQLVADIRIAAQEVALGSNQVAQSGHSLALGSTEQAASVQQFEATLNEVRQQSADNTSAATKALQMTLQTDEHMDSGMAYMQQVSEAMRSIDESSRQITTVIRTIEDIAFQTNILALNAAVEAARAGQHGKGFAVVADEVRTLATRSASAAHETSQLINASCERVQQGTEIVDLAGKTLNDMSQGALEITKFMEEITKASNAQSNALSDLTSGIRQISAVIHNNSAAAEQSAAFSQQMSAQAHALEKAVEQFKLRDKYLYEMGSLPTPQGMIEQPETEPSPQGMQPQPVRAIGQAPLF